MPTGVSIQNGTWTHVAVVIQKSDPVVSVFIDGKQEFISRNGLLVSDAELAVGLDDANMMLNSETISGSCIVCILSTLYKFIEYTSMNTKL